MAESTEPNLEAEDHIHRKVKYNSIYIKRIYQ